MHKIIKTGEWKYSGNTYLPILLVEQEPGHLHQSGYSTFSSKINENDTVYYLHFGNYFISECGQISSHSSSKPFLSEQEAINYAEINIDILKWNTDQ